MDFQPVKPQSSMVYQKELWWTEKYNRYATSKVGRKNDLTDEEERALKVYID